MNIRSLQILTALGGIILIIFFVSATTPVAVKQKSIPKNAPPDPATLAWTLATSSAAWGPRDSHAAFVFNDQMWVMGGLDANANVLRPGAVEYWNATYYKDSWSSRDGTEWSPSSVPPWLPRRSMVVIPFNGKVWMYGGWNPNEGYLPDIWFSEDAVAWHKAATPAPWTPREGHQIVEHNGSLYMVGGVNYATRITFNDVWRSEDGLTWTQMTTAAPWASRWDHGLASHNGKLFFAGGMTLTNEFFNDVWQSSDGAEWARATSSLPWHSRQGHALLSYRGLLWIIGRLNDESVGGVNDVWYSKEGIEWTKTALDPAWAGREDFGFFIFRDAMWILGGMDRDWRWQNDVWRASF